MELVYNEEISDTKQSWIIGAALMPFFQAFAIVVRNIFQYL